MTARDLLVVGGCLLAEPRSLVAFSFQPAAEPLNSTAALEPAAGILEADVSLGAL